MSQKCAMLAGMVTINFMLSNLNIMLIISCINRNDSTSGALGITGSTAHFPL